MRRADSWVNTTSTNLLERHASAGESACGLLIRPYARGRTSTGHRSPYGVAWRAARTAPSGGHGGHVQLVETLSRAPVMSRGLIWRWVSEKTGSHDVQQEYYTPPYTHVSSLARGGTGPHRAWSERVLCSRPRSWSPHDRHGSPRPTISARRSMASSCSLQSIHAKSGLPRAA